MTVEPSRSAASPLWVRRISDLVLRVGCGEERMPLGERGKKPFMFDDNSLSSIHHLPFNTPSPSTGLLDDAGILESCTIDLVTPCNVSSPPPTIHFSPLTAIVSTPPSGLTRDQTTQKVDGQSLIKHFVDREAWLSTLSFSRHCNLEGDLGKTWLRTQTTLSPSVPSIRAG